MSETSRPTIEIDEAPERPVVVWLDNGILRIGVLPAAGGRILSVQLHGQETLWRDTELLDDELHQTSKGTIVPHAGAMEAWVNLGGDKTWPAPQGWSNFEEWHGPPDPVLDSGHYSWETGHTETGVAISLTSAHDPRTGLTISRKLSLDAGASAYGLTVSARNSAERPVQWSVWNVTQRAADDSGTGGVWAGVSEVSTDSVVPLVTGTGQLAFEQASACTVHVPHQEVVGKLGLQMSTGWIAHVARGVSTTLCFPVVEGVEYPDRGARAEVWMEYPLCEPLKHLGGLKPKHRIVEIEVLSPYTKLQPGEEVALGVRCGLSSGTGEVRNVSEAGHWGPTVERGEGVSVSFYPYRGGMLRAVGDGAILGEVSAGRAALLAVSRQWAGTTLELVTPGEVAFYAGSIPEVSVPYKSMEGES